MQAGTFIVLRERCKVRCGVRCVIGLVPGLIAVLLLLPCAAARAALLYTYNYDLSVLDPGITGSVSFTTPSFITATSFVPAIYHNDPAGHPFQQANFRNPFQPVDGAALVANPVLDMILDGFSIGGFIGGPVDQFGTIAQLNFGPGENSSLTIAPTADNSVAYTYDYDFNLFAPGIAGSFSFAVPTFITHAISFVPIQHDDPAGHPLEYLGFRNAFQTYDGSTIVNPVIDLVLDGFSIGGLIPGPLDHTGTFVQFDNGDGERLSLTISGTPEVSAVPEPGSLVFVAGLAGLGWLRRRKDKAAGT